MHHLTVYFLGLVLMGSYWIRVLVFVILQLLQLTVYMLDSLRKITQHQNSSTTYRVYVKIKSLNQFELRSRFAYFNYLLKINCQIESSELSLAHMLHVWWDQLWDRNQIIFAELVASAVTMSYDCKQQRRGNIRLHDISVVIRINNWTMKFYQNTFKYILSANNYVK